MKRESKNGRAKKNGKASRPADPPAEMKRRGAAICAMSEAELAGNPDQENPRHLELVVGPLDEAGEVLTMYCEPADADERGRLVSRFPAEAGAARLLLPKGCGKADALRYLDQIRGDIERYWGGMCLDPEVMWTIIYDVREEARKAPKPPPQPVDDADPDTWPVKRIKRAAEGVLKASGMAFLKASPEYQRAWLGRVLPPDQAAESFLSLRSVVADLDAEVGAGRGKPNG